MSASSVTYSHRHQSSSRPEMQKIITSAFSLSTDFGCLFAILVFLCAFCCFLNLREIYFCTTEDPPLPYPVAFLYNQLHNPFGIVIFFFFYHMQSKQVNFLLYNATIFSWFCSFFLWAVCVSLCKISQNSQQGRDAIVV